MLLVVHCSLSYAIVLFYLIVYTQFSIVSCFQCMLGIVYRVSFREECNVITRESSRVHDDIIFIVKALSVKEGHVTPYSGRSESRISHLYYK